jgi:hypothetical protein
VCDLRRRVGSIRRFSNPPQEPSKVPGSPTFENLTPGFEAVDAQARSPDRTFGQRDLFT